MWHYRIPVILMLSLLLVTQAKAQSEWIAITPENLEQMVFGYAIPGMCGQFTPDSRYMSTGGGVYDLWTGEQVFTAVHDGYVMMTEDGSLIGVAGDGVYEVGTWTKRFAVDGYVTFSPNGQYALVERGADIDIIETTTGQLVFEPYSSGRFAPDSRLFTTYDHGVYDIATRTQVYPTNDLAIFSPDMQFFAVRDEGMYSAATGELLYPITGPVYDYNFSPDGQLVALLSMGVLEIATGEYAEQFAGNAFGGYFAFDPTNRYMVSAGNGVYEIATGEKVVTGLRNQVKFDYLGQFISDMDGIYSLQSEAFYPMILGNFTPHNLLVVNDNVTTCAIYGHPDNPWPYRHGELTVPREVTLYDAPDGAVIEENVYQYQPPQGMVWERTADNTWFRIEPDEDIWVRAADVEIITMPEAVPVVR